MRDFAVRRRLMVETQLAARGIDDPVVLAAMGTVPREAFVPERLADAAYDDGPLPIGDGQTISQPYVVALMIQALEVGGDARALEIGTGSGYAAAVLSRVVRDVYTVERLPTLAETAGRRLRDLGYDNVHVRVGDGTLGWPEHAPYDAVVVTAGAPDVPTPLLAQLRVGGRLVIPVGPSPRFQTLLRITRREGGDARREDLGAVAFVPLIGVVGWPEDEAVAPRREQAPAGCDVP